jgi:carbonic anhydrase
VVVCGHLGCGGVRAALASESAPEHVEAWINPLRMLARLHGGEIARCQHDEHKVDKLVELNVVEQVQLLARHPTVRKAWQAGRPLRLHGWVFDLPHGVLVPKVEVVNGSESSTATNGERRAAL